MATNAYTQASLVTLTTQSIIYSGLIKFKPKVTSQNQTDIKKADTMCRLFCSPSIVANTLTIMLNVLRTVDDDERL